MKRIDDSQQLAQDSTLSFDRSALRTLDDVSLENVEGGTTPVVATVTIAMTISSVACAMLAEMPSNER